MNSKKTPSVTGERIFQIFLVILGASIALMSTWVAQRHDKNEKRIETVSIIRSSVERELHLCYGISALISKNRDANFDGQYFIGSFQFAHTDELLVTIMPNLSNLKREIINKFNIYYINLKQCQAFRDLLVKSLENSQFKPSQTSKEITAYLISLEALAKSGNELILSLKKEYPEGDS